MWIICSMLYGPTNTGSYVKVTGIVVDLGVHDAPDLHLGLHWQSRLSFQEKQVRFCGKSNKKKDFIQVKPLKQISKCIPHPTIPSSFPLLYIYIYTYSILCFFQFLPKSTANFWFPKTKKRACRLFQETLVPQPGLVRLRAPAPAALGNYATGFHVVAAK